MGLVATMFDKMMFACPLPYLPGGHGDFWLGTPRSSGRHGFSPGCNPRVRICDGNQSIARVISYFSVSGYLVSRKLRPGVQ